MVTEASALETLQQRMQHPFSEARLLNQALTHRSFSADHNERLEFLGDSVLNLAVSDMLYAVLTDLPEGDLSRIRANLVKQVTGTVRWRESVDAMAKSGISLFVEVGSGKVLTGLVKRIAAEAEGISAGTPDDIAAVKSRILG